MINTNMYYVNSFTTVNVSAGNVEEETRINQDKTYPILSQEKLKKLKEKISQLKTKIETAPESLKTELSLKQSRLMCEELASYYQVSRDKNDVLKVIIQGKDKQINELEEEIQEQGRKLDFSFFQNERAEEENQKKLEAKNQIVQNILDKNIKFERQLDEREQQIKSLEEEIIELKSQLKNTSEAKKRDRDSDTDEKNQSTKKILPWSLDLNIIPEGANEEI